jgi:hypothetical protein
MLGARDYDHTKASFNPWLHGSGFHLVDVIKSYARQYLVTWKNQNLSQ